MSVRSILTTVCLLSMLGMSRLLLPSGASVSSETLAHLRGGTYCYTPVPVNKACLDCIPLDDPPTKWGECNSGGESYDCEDYTNPTVHYGPDCQEYSAVCGGVRYEYSDDQCDNQINMYPYSGCNDGVPFVRMYDSDYVSGGGLVPHCPL